ncbi:MAG: sulfatase-like hydrolase/transferase [Elusimicrobiota bacterium]|jgi:hypothetical protein|nr:sulfatase-like hydrolase/transferase [Elusimicrobiota bacterium]
MTALNKEAPMLNFVKKYLSLFKQEFWVYTALALPGLIMYFIGVAQLGAADRITLTAGALVKYANEFLTIAALFCLLHFLGFKKRWFFALALFFYYLTVSADIALLIYFKERFGLKYAGTLFGGQYAFLLDIRLILYLTFLYFYPYFVVRRAWAHRSSRHASAKKIAAAAVLMLLLALISPLRFVRTPNTFYARALMQTTLIEIVTDAFIKKPPYTHYTQLPAGLEALAQKYNLFAPTDFVNAHNYERIILLTGEAVSNKFLNSFNASIPPEASYVLDDAAQNYPFASLRYSALSTLYGLSVIFSGHPNAELMYKNDFPLSFVKVLRDGGFKTAFIRGADEEYMDEHIIFKSAGFEEVYGARYFTRSPQYSNSVAWWGLTDRKLFEFAIDYLKENKDKKVFINILNVDTHVPSGRRDYPGQDYPPLAEESGQPRKVKKLYGRQNMARAFYRFNYDLGLFIDALREEGLFDDKTLLILTGDHPFFANMDTASLFKNYRPVYDEVPFALITAKTPAEPVATGVFKSQQDIAPTILGLAGFKTPRGMFGRSIFEPGPRTLFYMKNNYAVIENQTGRRMVPFNTTRPEEADIIKLLNSTLE